LSRDAGCESKQRPDPLARRLFASVQRALVEKQWSLGSVVPESAAAPGGKAEHGALLEVSGDGHGASAADFAGPRSQFGHFDCFVMFQSWVSVLWTNIIDVLLIV